MTTDRIREALLPCPFCGEAPIATCCEDGGMFFVECSQHANSTHTATSYGYTANEAIARWNNRAALAEPAAVQGVPREPTREMIATGTFALERMRGDTDDMLVNDASICWNIWASMYDAAPQAAAQPTKEPKA